MTSTNPCSNIPPYPKEIGTGAGALLNGSPLICGGYDDVSNQYKKTNVTQFILISYPNQVTLKLEKQDQKTLWSLSVSKMLNTQITKTYNC